MSARTTRAHRRWTYEVLFFIAFQEYRNKLDDQREEQGTGKPRSLVQRSFKVPKDRAAGWFSSVRPANGTICPRACGKSTHANVEILSNRDRTLTTVKAAYITQLLKK